MSSKMLLGKDAQAADAKVYCKFKKINETITLYSE